MSLNKVTYVSGTTVITADNLNDIQDAILANETSIGTLTSGKQSAPTSAGTAGQVLGLDSNLSPVWVDNGDDDLSVSDDGAGTVTLTLA